MSEDIQPGGELSESDSLKDQLADQLEQFGKNLKEVSEEDLEISPRQLAAGVALIGTGAVVISASTQEGDILTKFIDIANQVYPEDTTLELVQSLNNKLTKNAPEAMAVSSAVTAGIAATKGRETMKVSTHVLPKIGELCMNISESLREKSD